MAVERTRQQRTPANFGPSATALSGADTSSANFVRQGVVDGSSSVGYKTGTAIAKAAGELGSSAIKAAKEFRDGFQLAEHQAKIEGDIEEYVKSKKNPEIADEAAIDLTTLDTMSNSLWAQLGSGADISDIDAVEKQFQDTSKRLKSALDQGVMSPNDFALRMLTNTREAVNKNPALHDEIINHTKKIMNLSGMDSLLKAEESAAKSEAKIMEERVKDNQTFLFQNNVMPKYNRDGSYDLHTNEMNAQSIAQERFAADVIQRQGVVRGALEEAKAADWMDKFGIPGVNGLITNTTNAALELLSNPENKTNQIATVSMMLNNTLAQIQEKAGGLGHLPGPRMALDIAEKRVNSILKTLESFATNEQQANFLKNEAGIARDQDNINVMKNYSPAAIELSTKLIGAIGDPKLLMDDTPLYIGMKNTLAGILSVTTNNPNVNYGMVLPNGKNGVAEGFKALATQASKGDETSTDALTKFVSTVYADTKNDKFKSPQEKFAFYDKYISALGTEGSGKMDMEGVGKASENLEEYMNMTLSNFQADIDKLGKKGVGVRMQVIGDGRLGIVTDNPADTEMMVKKYGIRINNGLRAFSSLSNSGTKESADRFYGMFEPLRNMAENDFGKREDGTAKGNGFLGVLKRPDGGVSTEISVGVNLNGENVEIPTLVPTLTKSEVNSLLNLKEGEMPSNEIMDKAVEHARGRINKGLSPFASKGETQVTQASTKVNPPNESNPFNLTIPGKTGNFQKFKSEQQGIVEASKQLWRYQNVGNPVDGKKLNTVREMALKWNNEKEPKSASARTYLNTIVNHSKLDPDAKIDTNDTDTMVALLYGMSRAEGNPLTKREIRLAVEGERL